MMTASSVEQSAFDLRKLRAMGYGGEAIEREILRDFLAITRDDEQELRGHLANRDYPRIRRCVHRIKGASHAVAAVDLCSACEALEAATIDTRLMAAASASFFNALSEAYACGAALLEHGGE